MRRVPVPALLATLLLPAAFAQQPILGVTVSPVSAEVAEFLGIEGGLKIDSVTEGLGAAKAGIQRNDLLVEVEGHSPVTLELLRETLAGHEPGDRVALGLIRRGERLALKVVLSEAPVLEDVTEVEEPPKAEGKPPATNVYGARGLFGGVPAAQAETLAKHIAEARERALAASPAAIEAGQQAREKAIREMLQNHKQALEHGELREALEKALHAAHESSDVKAHVERAIREATKSLEKQAKELAKHPDPLAKLWTMQGNDVPLVASVPTLDRVFAGQGGASTKELQERLERIEDRLARIEELLGAKRAK
jgi:hypothetical protein